MLVFGGRAVLNEIPGDDGHIGSRRQSVKLNDRARQAGSRVDAAPIGSGTWRGGLLWRVKQLPRRQDMRIGNLSDEHNEPFLVKTKVDVLRIPVRWAVGFIRVDGQQNWLY
jgi:hypothetical protein